MNSTALPGFNKSAVLSLYNLNFTNPIIQKDGSECHSQICTKLDYTNGTLVFSITGFSTYSASEGHYCSDSICNNGETCSTCPADCGSCSNNENSNSRSSEKEPEKIAPIIQEQEKSEESTEETENQLSEEISQTSEKENMPKITGSVIKSTSGMKPNSYYAIPALLGVILLSTLLYIKRSGF